MQKSLYFTLIMAILLAAGGMAGCSGLPQNQAKEFYNKGVTLEDQGRYDEAIAEYNRALEADRNYIKAYSNRGHAYLVKKQYDLAIVDYTRAIGLDPKHTVSYNGRGTAYYNLKQYNLAVLDYNQAIKLDPSLAQTSASRDTAMKMLTQASDYNRQGVVLINAGKQDEAVASFTKAIEGYPNYPSAWTNRGIVYLIRKQYDPAARDFDSALKLNANFAPAGSSRGLAYVYTARYREAVADLDKSLQVEPKDANAWNNRGVALEQLGEPEKALDSYNKAFQLDPNSVGFKANVVRARQGGKPGGVAGCYIRYYGPRYEKAWEGMTESSDILPPEATLFEGGTGITNLTLTGVWENNGTNPGLVQSDGGINSSKWNYDVEMNLVETDPNTGGLHVQQPNTFTGPMKLTLRSITGPASSNADIRAQIGKTQTSIVTGTREGSTVKLNYGGRILVLTFGGDYLYGSPSYFDPGSQMTWTWTFNLRRK